MAVRYAISWLYGEFRVALIRRRQLEAHWVAPDKVETTAQLLEALDAAADHMDLSLKGDVVVVHEHDLHSHDYLEVPAMGKRDLEKYLHRRVEQDKTFIQKPAWCYHQVRHKDGKQGVLLHLLPKDLVDATTKACAAAGLAPKSYVPLTEIVSDHLPSVDLIVGELVLVVANFAERTELIVAHRSGEALFVRELSYGGVPENLERLVTDINRTIRYARQQLGRVIDMALIMGQMETAVLNACAERLEVPVAIDEDANDPFFWALAATRLSGRLSANFISVFAQNNLDWELARRVGVLASVAMLVVSIGSTLIAQGWLARIAGLKSDAQADALVVQKDIDQVRDRLESGQRKVDHLARLRTAGRDLPTRYLAYLTRVVPPEVTLTRIQFGSTDQGVELALQGFVPGDLRQGARTLAGFERALQARPWEIEITESFTRLWMEQFARGGPDSERPLRFVIRGRLG
ncbi:MAG: hypothetical protein AAF513_00370 [Pseudomonadota bacterium]